MNIAYPTPLISSVTAAALATTVLASAVMLAYDGEMTGRPIISGSSGVTLLLCTFSLVVTGFNNRNMAAARSP